MNTDDVLKLFICKNYLINVYRKFTPGKPLADGATVNGAWEWTTPNGSVEFHRTLAGNTTGDIKFC